MSAICTEAVHAVYSLVVQQQVQYFRSGMFDRPVKYVISMKPHILFILAWEFGPSSNTVLKNYRYTCFLVVNRNSIITYDYREEMLASGLSQNKSSLIGYDLRLCHFLVRQNPSRRVVQGIRSLECVRLQILAFRWHNRGNITLEKLTQRTASCVM